MGKKRLSMKMDIDIELCDNPKDVDEGTVLKGILDDIKGYVTKDDDDNNHVKVTGKVKSMDVIDSTNTKNNK